METKPHRQGGRIFTQFIHQYMHHTGKSGHAIVGEFGHDDGMLCLGLGQSSHRHVAMVPYIHSVANRIVRDAQFCVKVSNYAQLASAYQSPMAARK